MSTGNNLDPVKNRAQLRKALRCRFDSLSEATDFAVGGRAITPDPHLAIQSSVGGKATMPDPGLAIQSFGKFDTRISREGYLSDVKALSTFASLAGYGLGSETLIDLEVRKTSQVDASKISITNPNWALALRALIEHIGKDMNFESETVEPKLYKLLICCPGGHFKAPVDNEKHDGMFGTLMIELASDYRGGNLIASHCGTAVNATPKTFDNRAFYHMRPFLAAPRSVGCMERFGMKFLAHYAGCKHEVSEVSSGYRLALMYSLCWTQICQKGPTPREDISNDIVRHLSSFEGCLGYILKQNYSIDSLRVNGAKALKGSDRMVYEFLTNASSITESQASTISDNLTMYIVKASREDHDGELDTDIREPEVRSYKDDIFALDGSEPSERDVKVLETFRTSGYEDIINLVGQVKNDDAHNDDKTMNNRFWRDRYGEEPTYVGYDGGLPIQTPSTFMLTFWRKNWSKTIL